LQSERHNAYQPAEIFYQHSLGFIRLPFEPSLWGRPILATQPGWHIGMHLLHKHVLRFTGDECVITPQYVAYSLAGSIRHE
jgi:hypothetical protein